MSLEDISRCPFPFPVSDATAARSQRAAFHQLNALKRELPTRYEDLAAYSVFRMLLDRVVNVAKEETLPRSISFGTAAFLSPNATIHSLREDHDEILIVFSRALLHFCLQVAEFFATLLVDHNGAGKGAIELQIRARRPSQREISRLYDILANAIRRFECFYDDEGGVTHVIHDRLAIRRPLHLSTEGRIVREVVLEAMETFIVGHEVGHTILLKASTQQKYREMIAELTPTQDIYGDEHACDYIGQQLGVQATIAKFRDLLPLPFIYALGMIGGPLFLSALRLTQLSAHLVKRGEPMREVVPCVTGSSAPEASHPPIFVRIHLLTRYITNVLEPSFDPQRRVAPLKLYRQASAFLDKCWVRLEPSFKAMHLKY